MELDQESCYQAIESCDPRFDGWFFVGVRSTGIYCRPSCPARTPKRENVTIQPTAAAAHRAGYRACKRCRPDAVPGSPEWDRRGDVVARAVRLIADGVVDREGVAGLASRLAYSPRQLQRLLNDELGAGPLALARAERARTARVLLETTEIPISHVAFGAGFSSVRQFNDTVRSVFGCPPSALRRHRPRTASGGERISLRLGFRAPLEPGSLFGHLIATAAPGIEAWDGESLVMAISLPRGGGVVRLRPAHDHVVLSADLEDLRDLSTAVARCRGLLDLDADPIAIDAHLAADPVLAPLVGSAPGRRIPGSLDAEQMALRAVLSQQVSTKAAGTVAGRLAAALGEPVDRGGVVTHRFPSPEAIASAPDSLLAMPATRRATVRRVAAALADGSLDLSPGCDRAASLASLASIKGIGSWTVGIVAMRGLRDPDVALEGDLGIRTAAARLGLGSSSSELARRSRRWRPWRSYAAQHLWATGDPRFHTIPTLEDA